MPEKYQEEIEEILRQAGDLRPPSHGRRARGSIWRLVWLHIVQSLGGKAFSLSPGRIILAALALLLSTLIVRAIVPGLVVPLAWAGLLLFLVGYAMLFVKPRKMEKRWRGQPLEQSGESWWDRLRRRLK